MPRVRCEHAGEQIDQRRLAGAVRPDDADAVAAMDADRKVAHDTVLSPQLLEIRLGVDDARAAFLALGHGHLDRAGDLELLAAARAQGAQLGETALVALAPRADAIADPVLFHRDLAVELVTLDLLLREHLVAPGLEEREAALQSARHAAVEPHRRARKRSPGSAGRG